MAIFNSLTFDGQNSLDNGVFISAEAVYDAPERDIEEIEIAGRNGAFLLDKGRWKNIEVTYKAGAFGSDQSEFATKIRNFRNLMASRIGYKRLTDTYNPNEFRLGTFKDAFEVEPKSANRHGGFDLVFNCKPQRYLTSGETEITVTSGQTITNPTAYDASPLVELQGYGTVNIGGKPISIKDNALGKIVIGPSLQGTSVTTALTFDTAFLNIGDEFYIPSLKVSKDIECVQGAKRILGVTGQVTAGQCVPDSTGYGSSREISVKEYPDNSFVYGTAGTHSFSAQFTIDYYSDAPHYDALYSVIVSVVYDGDDTVTVECSESEPVPTGLTASDPYWTSERAEGISTIGTSGSTFFIDFETGDIFVERSGEVMSFNRFADLGSDLLTLKPGANEVTYDNTVTLLKITPRWFIL